MNVADKSSVFCCCNFLRCLIHEVSASHKPSCVTHINSVIHIPPPPFFLCMFISDALTDLVIIFYIMWITKRLD